jgi:hypothetical protein
MVMGPSSPESTTRRASFRTGVALGDFNGDGILDVTVVTYNCCGEGSVVSVLLGNGDGTFRSPVNYNRTDTAMVAVGDFNGDKAEDLVVTEGGGFRVLFGNGDGTLQSTSLLDPLSGISATADFNNDGKLDLVDSLLNLWSGFGPRGRDLLAAAAEQSHPAVCCDRGLQWRW